MRIKPESEALIGAKKGGKTTRAERASAHAAARIKARHVERDYFGRPVVDPKEQKIRDLSPAAVKREKTGTVRLDAWLVANGLSVSRDKAKVLISSGSVYVDGSNDVKPSLPVSDDMDIRVAESEEPAL